MTFTLAANGSGCCYGNPQFCDSGHLHQARSVPRSTTAVLESTAMKKLLILGALGIFLAAHGVVIAMTIYPRLDAYSCDGSNC
jgi:hypothetical protein